ncbi:MAG: ionic transporter y4hA [Alphaproteobacteria bacterium]|nr:ionic transporter y4hA [Alphaproteobacteria bacterium]
MTIAQLPAWTWASPIAGLLLLPLIGMGAPIHVALVAALIASVLAAVHHAEVVAHRVGEPYGTLILAVAVTMIEVALIVSLMIEGGPATAALARDTIFAAIMIILNGMVGLCLLVGGAQAFGLYGVSAGLTTLSALAVLTLVLPNHTTSVAGPFYSASQLIFVAIVSVVLYGTFVLIQTVRHRDYFLPAGAAAADETAHAPPPPASVAWISAGLLLVSLGAVVLLAKALSPTLERAVSEAGAPKPLVGIIIAAVVLLPESLAAYRAARADRLQTSLNLALGSALASIALTVPTVAVLSVVLGWNLVLGLEPKDSILLAISLLVAALSLGTGRTTVLQGAVHLVLFAVFVFTTIVP